MALLSSVALADSSSTPEAHAYIERFGSAFPFDHEQEIIALYTRILTAERRDNHSLQVTRDLRYGDDARNRLDVHVMGSKAGASRPVLVFFHGGGFYSGDTRVSGEIYDNVANYFARNGLVAVNATYRLTPEAHWPSGVQDVAAAVSWTRAHIADYGGDPKRIFLMGHSAGAVHVAGYIFASPPAADPGIAGAILFSGLYNVPDKPNNTDYYGTDSTQRFNQSPMNFVTGAARMPTLVMFGQYDPPPMQLAGIGLIQKLCERDQSCPAISEVMGHNHMSEIFHFDTSDDSGARDILAFVRQSVAR